MKNLHTKDVVKYVVLPGIIPRARKLFASGFGTIAFLMASIYGMVRLLPANHPYLNPANMGKFGIRHVIAEAANHLVVKKENIDQIIIFSALMAGTVLLFLQFAMLGYSLLVPEANAQIFSLFTTPAPERDIAFLLLDRVFGVPGLFCSYGVCTEIQGDLPMPFHDALHALWSFYSLGLLCVGVLIFLYFVVVVVVETAVSGSPFGQRFEDIWVPIRLVVALALLVPINWGLNSAQYITLYSAKIGSSFATNAWLTFNRTILDASQSTSNGSNPIGETETLIALTNAPEVTNIVQGMSIVHACAYAYWRSDTGTGKSADYMGGKIKPYFVKSAIGTKNTENFLPVTEQTTYQQALDFYDNYDIIIRWGERNTDKHKGEKGNVSPDCGEIRVKATPLADSTAAEADLSGKEYLSMRYFEMIKSMWFENVSFQQFATRMVELKNPTQGSTKALLCTSGVGCGDSFLPACSPSGPNDPCNKEAPTSAWRQKIIDDHQVIIWNDLREAWERESENAPYDIDQDILERGWGGAGIWYNKIAEMNGAFIGAVMEIPRLQTYPKIMEKVRTERMKNDAKVAPVEQFSPTIAGGAPMTLPGEDNDMSAARGLDGVYQYWNKDDPNQANQDKTSSSNIFVDIINMLFGTQGIMDIRNDNANVHPLAQLVAIGKGLVETTIRNIAISTGLSATSGFLLAIDQQSSFGKMAGTLAGLASSLSFVGLTAGLTLFYVLPFLPFVYFFFTVGTWIKTIFEAMVGVPLWALAHLRLDGNGLPGEAAQNGYFLIFEIFLRPILAVFGLIAAIVIFSAEVRILNFTWDLVVSNTTGFNGDPNFTIVDELKFQRSTLDEFFFTIIYTIIVYLFATASFKLIDSIPDGILRWMSAGVSTFSDINEDPTEGLKKYVATGGLMYGQRITEGISEAAKGVGGTLGGLVKGPDRPAGPPPPPPAAAQ